MRAVASSTARAAVVLLAATLAAETARADGLFDRRVDASRLGSVRGGFSAPDGGLIVSFGVQRAVLVDGVPVATAGDASTLLVLQRGPNNAFAAVPGAATVGTVIQNSLDNQKLQAVTTLDVTANSLQAFRGAALQATLRTALGDATRR